MQTRILFTGDCRIDGIYHQGVRNFFDLFPDYDLYVINFESSIRIESSSSMVRKSVSIAASLEDMEHLLACIEPQRLLLNFANNHSRDSGSENLIESKRWLRERGAHIIDCGESVHLEVKGQPFVFHAFGQTAWRTANENFSKAGNAHNVVLMHWGEEYVFQPHPAQREQAKLLARSGAELIVGGHPHVLQGSETFQECRIFYSLGNSVFGFKGMPVEGHLGSGLSVEYGEAGITAERIPLKIMENGRIERLTQKLNLLADKLDENTQISESEWYREAAVPFFKNHLKSWHKRIASYGGGEVVRFLRACCSHMYLKMFKGLISGVVHGTRRTELLNSVFSLLNG
jgi:hypothetical protein